MYDSKKSQANPLLYKLQLLISAFCLLGGLAWTFTAQDVMIAEISKCIAVIGGLNLLRCLGQEYSADSKLNTELAEQYQSEPQSEKEEQLVA